MFFKHLFNIYLDGSLNDALEKDRERACMIPEPAISSVVLTYSVCPPVLLAHLAIFIFYWLS